MQHEVSLEYYGAYYLGALQSATKIIEEYIGRPCNGDGKVYRDAELRLITSDKRSMQLYMEGVKRIHYRNHERDKKGKLIKCEAYFGD